MADVVEGMEANKVNISNSWLSQVADRTGFVRSREHLFAQQRGLDPCPVPYFGNNLNRLNFNQRHNDSRVQARADAQITLARSLAAAAEAIPRNLIVPTKLMYCSAELVGETLFRKWAAPCDQVLVSASAPHVN